MSIFSFNCVYSLHRKWGVFWPSGGMKSHNCGKEIIFFTKVTVMAYYYILLFMVWLGTHLKCIATCPVVTVNIAIFYNVSDRYMPNILQNAEDMLLADRRKENSRGIVYLNRRRFNEAEMYSGHIGLNHSLFEMWNLSSRIHGAIFVDISSYSLFLSSMLEQLSIPTIGIFQSREQPRTRVRRFKLN